MFNFNLFPIESECPCLLSNLD